LKRRENMKRSLGIILMAVALAALTSCAPGPNSSVNTPIEKGFVPGFWYGLWNGAIAPVTFVISLFNSKVQIYEIHNNGNWYNFGFLLGVGALLGGGAGGGAASRRRRG
jgi:hypothetical protein